MPVLPYLTQTLNEPTPPPKAERWGAELYTEDVESVDLSQRPFVVRNSERTVRAHSVIIATGATARRLGLPSEATFWSKGISACAICDGASPLFKEKEVAVVGGGDSAAEEAVYLTKYASKVHLLVRGDKLRASKAMQVNGGPVFGAEAARGWVQSCMGLRQKLQASKQCSWKGTEGA